jgi:hypothetical protein
MNLEHVSRRPGLEHHYLPLCVSILMQIIMVVGHYPISLHQPLGCDADTRFTRKPDRSDPIRSQQNKAVRRTKVAAVTGDRGHVPKGKYRVRRRGWSERIHQHPLRATAQEHQTVLKACTLDGSKNLQTLKGLCEVPR